MAAVNCLHNMLRLSLEWQKLKPGLHRMQTPIPIETSILSSITSRRKFKSPEFSK
jgi:hypothetical protein